MKIFTLIIAMSAIATLCSCSEDASTTTQTDIRVSEDNVFSDQVRTLEKAEQVEDQIMDAFKKRDASINEN